MKSDIKEGIALFCAGSALMVYSLVSHYSVHIEWKLSPYLFPVVIAVFLMSLSAVLFIGSFYSDHEGKKHISKIHWKPLFTYLAAVLFYYIVLPHIGFIASNIMLLAGLFVLLGERVWWKISLLSLATTMLIYWLFHSFLHVMLP